MSDERESTNDGIGRRAFLATSAAGAAAIISSQIPGEVTAMTSENVGEDVDFRQKLLECLGGPWPEPCELRPKLRETIQQDGYRIESVTYEVEPGDRVPAMLLVPDGVDAEQPGPGRGRLAPAQRPVAPGQERAGRPGGQPDAPHGRGAGEGGLRGALPRRPLLRGAAERASKGRELRAVRVPPLRGRRQVHGLEEHPRHAAGGRLPLLAARGASETASAATATRWARRTPGWSGPGSRG